MRLADLAGFYGTLPLHEFRRLLGPGRTIIVGRAARALACSIDPQAHLIEAIEPLASLGERLIAALPMGCSARSLFVTDPDAAMTVLESPNILNELRRRIRYNLIIPVEGETRIRFVKSAGLSGFERVKNQAWRWIEGEVGECRFVFFNSGPSRVVRLAFLPWFSAFALSDKNCHSTTLTCGVEGHQRQYRVSKNEATEIVFPLGRGYSVVKIWTSLPAGTLEADSRIISLGFVNPKLCSESGDVLIKPEGFQDLPLELPFVVHRERLHRAGFYEVAGIVANGAGLVMPIPQTQGSPQLGLHLSPDLLSSIEPVAGTGEVCWFVAGDAAREVSS